jgi:transposase
MTQARQGGLAMRAYSMDLRERVLADVDAGLGTKAVAEKYRVSRPWVRRLKQRRREEGRIGPRPCRNPRRPALEAHAARLVELVHETPDATLAELRTKLEVSVSLPTLCRALRSLKLSFKKKSRTPASRTGPT